MKKSATQVKNPSLAGAIRAAYALGQEDEALEPIIKADSAGKPRGRLKTGDYVIFYDIRGEREVELTKSLTEDHFSYFPRQKDLHLHFVTMISYEPMLRAKTAFPAGEKTKNTLTEVIGRQALRLAKISESEKAVHVGYFFNGKSDEVFPGEERFIVPSPQNVASYVQKPEMSAALVVQEVKQKLQDRSYSVIIANLANVDVIGHSEDKLAVLKAVETVDSALGEVAEECRRQGVTLIVTSDHGTVEEWLYPDGTVNTGHTRNPVPFILAEFAGGEPEAWALRETGELADVAPTVLDVLSMPTPIEMTGKSLILGRPQPSVPGRRVALLILDGWGLKEEAQGNLILEAETPNFDRLWSRFPHSHLRASGEAVGLPSHTVGNSEAGHLHLGAGRRVFLDRVRIDRSIEDGTFFCNPVLLWAAEGAKRDSKALHLMGIVSHYSSHGTIKHLFALLRLAKNVGLKNVYIHAFIGRRGEKPESGAIYIEKVEETARALGIGETVTVLGRYWALDREENWDRVEKAYRALVHGEGTKVKG